MNPACINQLLLKQQTLPLLQPLLLQQLLLRRAIAAAATAAAQKRSFVKNQRFLPLLNFSSNSFLASCSRKSSDTQSTIRIQLCQLVGHADWLPAVAIGLQHC